MYSDQTTRFFYATARFPAYQPWVMERSLSLGPQSSKWFPVAAGYGKFWSPAYSDMLYGAYDQNQQHGFYARLQGFPVVPVPPRPASVGMGPRPQYQFAHAALRYRISDGSVVAVWRNVNDPAGQQITAVFPQSELDLSDLAGLNRYPFAVGCLTGAATDTPPIFLSYSVFPLFANEELPAATANLSGNNAAVRSFMVLRGADMRADMWPPPSAMPPEPPTPVTLAERSFYRLRTAPQLAVDGNSNGIPDSMEALFNIDPKLIISEACFLRTAATVQELIGGEAADWVEVWNPTSNTISTADYYFSDNSTTVFNTTDPRQFPLPLRNMAPGEYLIIHCSPEGKARLALNDPLQAVTAAIELDDKGEKIYLKKKISNTALSIKDTFNPPSSSATFPLRAIANISYGIQAAGNGSYGFGYFGDPTPGALNRSKFLGDGTNLAIACAEPTVEDSASNPLLGKVFRSGSFTAYLKNTDAGATLVYTLNGTEPTGQSAVYDSAHPIVIGGTTVLRAQALKANRLPSATVTRTFIHTPSVPSQVRPGTLNTPLNDPEISSPYQSAAPPLAGYAAAGGITDQLEARPSIFLTYPTHEDLGSNTPTWAQTTTGSPVSVEYCDPANPAAYSQENGYIRLSGNHNGTKDSWHLLFKKSANLKGDNRWRTPLLAAPHPQADTSAMFPGSPVRDLNRLVLRSPGFDAYEDILGGDGNATYLKDAYLKETQRLLGGFTGRRRWVHLHLNGLYWGLYDLEEHHNKDTISDHLIAGLSNPTATDLTAHAPEQVLFLNFDEQGEPADPPAVTSWNAMVAAAAAARQSPGNTTLWNDVAN